MRGVLVQIQPLDPASGGRVTLRFGQSRNSRTLSADGLVWHSAITRAPKISMEFVDENLGGQLQSGRGDMVINTSRIAGYTRKYLDSLTWIGSPITIWSGDGALTSDMTVEFVGSVRKGVVDKASRQVSLAFEVDRKAVDVPLLNLEYGGGGGTDGDVEIRGQLKPAGFGSPVNVPVFFFNQVSNVGQIDAYGNCTAIDNLYEDAASFGTKLANYASYSLLVAATIPAGQWATCVAEGMIRLGAPPKGIITCDPVCANGKPGLMMLRWLQSHAGVSAGKINSASFNTLDTDLQTLLGHSPAVSYWTQGQVSALERIQAMCASCNAVPLLTPDGKIAVARSITTDAAALTLNRHGGPPIVLDWKSSDGPIPWWRLKMTSEITYRVHNDNEIDYEDDLKDLGDWITGTQYRQGNIVRLPSDGRSYLYINSVPSTFGPPNVTYWSIYNEAPDASVIKYIDGVAVETLRPAEVGATQTGGGLNELDDTMFVGWANTGATRLAKNATNGFANGNEPWLIDMAPGSALRQTIGPLVAVIAAQPYNFSLFSQRNSGVNAAAGLHAGGDWLDATGATISAATEMEVQTTLTLTAGAIPLEKRWSQSAPALARYFRPKIWVPITTAGGNFRAERMRVSAVEFAADVSAVIQGPATLSINADSAGVLQGSSPYAQGTYNLMENGAAATGITWSTNAPAGVTTTFTGVTAGALQITGLTVDSVNIVISAARTGKPTRTFTVNVSKNKGAPPTSGGGGSATTASQTSAFASIASGTATPISNALSMTSGAGGVTTLAAALQNDPPYGGNKHWADRCQWYRWNGSAYVAIGTTFDFSLASAYHVNGFTNGEGYYEPPYDETTPGTVSNSQTYTGTANTAELFKLYAFHVAATSSNTTDTLAISGQISATGS